MLRSVFSLTAHPVFPGSALARAASCQRRGEDLSVELHPRAVEVAQRRGGEAGGNSVERGEQPRPVPHHAVPRIRGVMFSRWLQGAVVGQDDQVPRGEIPDRW